MNSRIFATQFLLIDLSGRRNEKKSPFACHFDKETVYLLLKHQLLQRSSIHLIN